MINYNMRCIETNIAQRDNRSMSKINYNMRCIETGRKNITVINAEDKLQHEMY